MESAALRTYWRGGPGKDRYRWNLRAKGRRDLDQHRQLRLQNSASRDFAGGRPRRRRISAGVRRQRPSDHPRDILQRLFGAARDGFKSVEGVCRSNGESARQG